MVAVAHEVAFTYLHYVTGGQGLTVQPGGRDVLPALPRECGERRKPAIEIAAMV